MSGRKRVKKAKANLARSKLLFWRIRPVTNIAEYSLMSKLEFRAGDSWCLDFLHVVIFMIIKYGVCPYEFNRFHAFANLYNSPD
jgi:hypothetical protein